jgi:hypothetical protein
LSAGRPNLTQNPWSKKLFEGFSDSQNGTSLNPDLNGRFKYRSATILSRLSYHASKIGVLDKRDRGFFPIGLASGLRADAMWSFRRSSIGVAARF